MATYTIDIYTLLQDKNFKLFDFDYEFYSDEAKEGFEEKFINRYMFDEIGFETVMRFKHYLKEKLNRIAPYYKQLYETEVRCMKDDIDFMLNKDLREKETIKGTNSSNSKTNATSNSTSKESSLDNGNATLDLNDSITNISNSIGSGITNNDVTGENDQIRELLSQGNIGITSNAELLKQWRQVLINIDEMIIEECRDLFMMIY